MNESFTNFPLSNTVTTPLLSLKPFSRAPLKVSSLPTTTHQIGPIKPDLALIRISTDCTRQVQCSSWHITRALHQSPEYLWMKWQKFSLSSSTHQTIIMLQMMMSIEAPSFPTPLCSRISAPAPPPPVLILPPKSARILVPRTPLYYNGRAPHRTVWLESVPWPGNSCCSSHCSLLALPGARWLVEWHQQPGRTIQCMI